MQNTIRYSVKNPITISMIVVGIILLGFISLRKLPIDLFPDINSPRIFIELSAGERPPEELEKRFVEGIESMAMRQKGVAKVASICVVGSATITVEYSWKADMDEAFLDMQKAMEGFVNNPEIDEINISQHDPNATPILIVGVKNTAIDDPNELRLVAESTIKNELIRLEGIADIQLAGTQQKEVIIETDHYRLTALKLTLNQIVRKIEEMNKNVSGGSVEENGRKYLIKGVALAASIDDIKNLIITHKTITKDEPENAKNKGSIDGKVPVFLKDVAEVSWKNSDPKSIVRVNGKRCIGLSIFKETGYNTVKAINSAEEVFGKLSSRLPGYEFIVIQNQGIFIKNAINEVKENALIGVIIAVFVLFLFLRRFKVTLIISLAIPISVIATFNLMYFNGLSVNIMTLGGIALGAGMLVDNAIIVVENIFRNRESGMSIKEAAITGTAEVGGAIIASTLTTIVVFLPIVYIHGASGILFKDQAWTVAFSLLASLFVAIFVIPVLFSQLYQKPDKKEISRSVKFLWYGKLLEKLLAKRLLVVGMAIVATGATALILPGMGKEYLPKNESREFTIRAELPEGTTIEYTNNVIRNIEIMLHQALKEKVEIVFSQIGTSDVNQSEKDDFKSENKATIIVRIKESALEQSSQIVNEISRMLEDIPDTRIFISRNESSLQSTVGTNEMPVSIEVSGESMDLIEQIADSVKQRIVSLPSLLNLKTSIEGGAPEIDMIIDRQKVAMHSVSIDAIISQLKEKLIGRDAGYFDYKGELNKIIIKHPDYNLDQLSEMTISANEKEIPLYELVSISFTNAPKQLLRNNQIRIGKVTADLSEGASLSLVAQQIKNKLKMLHLPQGYSLKISGEELMREKSMKNLRFALLLAIVLVYMVMASQFESLIHPFTILLTLPLAGVGAIWIFLILGKTLNIMAYIGIIMLSGIAVNDSIILVDAINRFKRKGNSLKESVIAAGQNRIRPIVMTSLTTIIALFPLTLGFGEGAALRSPMALAVIGGLVTSTLLTLVVIPCVYYLFDSIKLRRHNQ